jgi:hypothetical protein
LAKKSNNQTIEVIAQDPRYQQLEKGILGGPGVEIRALDDPVRGLLEVDDTSVVVAISAEIPVKQIICDIGAKPALILCHPPQHKLEDEYPDVRRRRAAATGEDLELEYPT